MSSCSPLHGRPSLPPSSGRPPSVRVLGPRDPGHHPVRPAAPREWRSGDGLPYDVRCPGPHGSEESHAESHTAEGPVGGHAGSRWTPRWTSPSARRCARSRRTPRACGGPGAAGRRPPVVGGHRGLAAPGRFRCARGRRRDRRAPARPGAPRSIELVHGPASPALVTESERACVVILQQPPLGDRPRPHAVRDQRCRRPGPRPGGGGADRDGRARLDRPGGGRGQASPALAPGGAAGTRGGPGPAGAAADPARLALQRRLRRRGLRGRGTRRARGPAAAGHLGRAGRPAGGVRRRRDRVGAPPGPTPQTCLVEESRAAGLLVLGRHQSSISRRAAPGLGRPGCAEGVALPGHGGRPGRRSRRIGGHGVGTGVVVRRSTARPAATARSARPSTRPGPSARRSARARGAGLPPGVADDAAHAGRPEPDRGGDPGALQRVARVSGPEIREIDIRMPRGSRVRGIVDACVGARLLVMGRDRSFVQRLVSGRTAAGVAERGSRPVESVPPDWQDTPRFGAVLVGVRAPVDAVPLLAHAFP